MSILQKNVNKIFQLLQITRGNQQVAEIETEKASREWSILQTLC